MSKDWGSKAGSGGVASASEANVQRRERLRQLALDTVDVTNDPYFMRNHLGSYECKLCLTLHTNEGSYLAHTQGKKHQQNLARRAAKLAKDKAVAPVEAKRTVTKKVVKIGRPGYKVVKQRDPETGARSLLFQLHYPQISNGVQPRHRLVSTFEQSVEARNDKVQYLLFAAEPYETVAFAIPNVPIERGADKFFTHWDDTTNMFYLQLFFVPDKTKQPINAAAAASADTGADDEGEANYEITDETE